MKALITGPRSRSSAPDHELPYLHLEVELEELPKVGETIIVNDGNSVVVNSIMWWVDGPDTPEAYSFNGGTYEGAAVQKVVHVNVLPPDWPSDHPYDAGKKAGRREAAQALGELLGYLRAVADAKVLHAAVTEWVKREEGAT